MGKICRSQVKEYFPYFFSCSLKPSSELLFYCGEGDNPKATKTLTFPNIADAKRGQNDNNTNLVGGVMNTLNPTLSDHAKLGPPIVHDVVNHDMEIIEMME